MSKRHKEVREFASELESEECAAGKTIPPPMLQPGQAVAWTELFRFTDAILSIMKKTEEPLERR